MHEMEGEGICPHCGHDPNQTAGRVRTTGLISQVRSLFQNQPLRGADEGTFIDTRLPADISRFVIMFLPPIHISQPFGWGHSRNACISSHLPLPASIGNNKIFLLCSYGLTLSNPFSIDKMFLFSIIVYLDCRIGMAVMVA